MALARLGRGRKEADRGGGASADLYEGVWSARKKNGRKTRRQRSPDTGTQVRMVCVGGVDGARSGTRPEKKWKAKRGCKIVADAFRPHSVGAG